VGNNIVRQALTEWALGVSSDMSFLAVMQFIARNSVDQDEIVEIFWFLADKGEVDETYNCFLIRRAFMLNPTVDTMLKQYFLERHTVRERPNALERIERVYPRNVDDEEK